MKRVFRGVVGGLAALALIACEKVKEPPPPPPVEVPPPITIGGDVNIYTGVDSSRRQPERPRIQESGIPRTPEPVRVPPPEVRERVVEPTPPPRSPVRRTDVAAPAAAPAAVTAAAMRSVFFKSVPANARLRLRNRAGQEFEAVSPATLSVPSDVYSWEVELPGYITERSLRNDVDVLANRADTVSVTLMPTGDVLSLYARADSLFGVKGGAGCAEAVRIYKQIAAPADARGAQGARWQEGQYRSGQCLRRMRDYDAAEETFLNILKQDPRQWTAKYELGSIYCDIRQFSKGQQQFRDLRGNFPLSVDIAGAVKAIAKYGEATCVYKELQSKEQPERFPDLRDKAISAYEEFLPSAEELLQRKVAPEVRKPLQDALDDAKRTLAKLEGGA